MSPSAINPLTEVKALCFDVFGTTVDWRSAVTEELTLRAHRKLSSPTLTTDLRDQLRSISLDPDDFWGGFAEAWRDCYTAFTRDFNPRTMPWKSVDENNRDSLVTLLRARNLEGLYTDDEITSLSLVWHRLSPWPDAPDGLAVLARKGYVTSSLSNGNSQLLRDLDDFGVLGFTRLLSAEDFGAYKPSREVYEGAVRELELESPGQLALVAAHLNDLDAARRLGIRTVYVERNREEAWARESAEYLDARRWVDLWIQEEDGGFVTLAQMLEGVV